MIENQKRELDITILSSTSLLDLSCNDFRNNNFREDYVITLHRISINKFILAIDVK